MTNTKAFHQQIKKLGVALPWLAALELARGAGGLPTNIQFEHAIRDNDKPFSLDDGSWWTGSIIAYPESGNAFAKGKDIADTLSSLNGDKKWVLPASCLPSEVFESEGKRICLLMDYYNLTITDSNVFIEPDPGTLRILSGFSQKSGKGGFQDAETGILLVPESGTNFDIAMSHKLYRLNCQSVVPISRGPFKGSINADVEATKSFNVSSIDIGLDDLLQNLN
jgi:hypothetical protein